MKDSCEQCADFCLCRSDFKKSGSEKWSDGPTISYNYKEISIKDLHIPYCANKGEVIYGLIDCIYKYYAEHCIKYAK